LSEARPLFRTPAPGQALVKPGEGASQNEIDAWEIAEEKRLREIVELPFLHGWKWYKWAADFRDSTNNVNLLCAANQISKSSTQIRKCLIWATDQTLWPSLWRQAPVQFWYLYPGQKQIDAEFETKWKLFLPKGEMKNDPYYGWKEERKKGELVAIHFNSGVHVYFKTYGQNVTALQTGTCDAIFCDEELPINLFDELMLRISASDGYFHMVFTATLGQDEWRRAMEPTEDEVKSGKEFLPQAFKQTVSLYDAMKYEDGTPSHWTLEKIKKVENRCSTQNEVLKRVWGKFIILGGRKYEAFDIKRHVKTKHPIPAGWLIYEGADVGGGKSSDEDKKDSHKAAICFVAVSPDYRKGRVFLGWRGDNETTTAGDVFVRHQKLVKDNKITVTRKFYDWGSKDFGTIATRAGDAFEAAEKSHEIGEEVINTLFKNDMLFIYEDEELMKLAGELASLKKNANKRTAKDDFSDALRYAVTKIPWDWTAITGSASDLDEKPEEPLTPMQREIKERREAFETQNNEEAQRIQDEFDEWNDAYG